MAPIGPSNAVVPADEGSEGRFLHLLRPIRDLAESWNIDLAAELAEYVEELEMVQISLDGGATAVNFAEAALLIQGSACVYSKKVEYLYSLVYQTLNRVSEKERAPQQPSTLDESNMDTDAPTPRLITTEFLALDDIPEASNLYLQDDQGGDEGITGKTPMLLLGAELGNDSGAARMHGASMHDSGVLMLDDWAAINDPASTRMLNTMLDGIATATGNRLIRMGAPSAPPGAEPSPVIAGQLTFDGGDYAGGYDDDDDDDCGGAADFEGGMYDGDVYDVFDGGGAGDPAADGGALAPAPFGGAHPEQLWAGGPACDEREAAQVQPAAAGPWAPLDPNDAAAVSDMRPLRRGRTWKLPPKSAAALSAFSAGLKRDVHGRQVAPQLHRAMAPAAAAAEASEEEEADGDGCGKERTGAERARVTRFADELLGKLGLLYESWPLKSLPGLHEDIHFAAALEAEGKRRAAVRKGARDDLARHTHVTPAYDAEVEADLEALGETLRPDAEDGFDRVATFDADDDDDFGGGEYGGEEGEEHFAGGAGHDSQMPKPELTRRLSFTPAPGGPTLTTYEKRYWSQLDALDQAHDAEAVLHARVSEWERKLLPLLEAQNERRQFDIQLYGHELLTKMPDAPSVPQAASKGAAPCVPFVELMAGQERFEVCRLFLAALQLANNGNIEIVHNEMGGDALELQLLTRESCFHIDEVMAA